MTVTRKNVPRPVITTNQQNGIDYIFLIILLLYLFIFLATLRCKPSTDSNASGATSSVTLLHEFRDMNESGVVM